MVNYCTVCFSTTRKNKYTSYFSYPKNATRRQAWLQAVGRHELIPKFVDTKIRQQYRICEEHFEPSSIKHSKKRTKKYLHDDAFPTLNLPKTHEAITRQQCEAASKSQGEVSTQENYIIPDILFSNTKCVVSKTLIFEDQSSCSEQEDDKCSKPDCRDRLSPIVLDVTENIKRKILPSVLEQTEESVTKEDFLKLCDNFITKGMSEIIKWQIDFKDERRQERQTQARNFFALNLHYSGPVAYRFLKNTFCLPPLSTLQKFVRPVDTKIDRRLLSSLKLKVDKMGVHERICSVCVGCMPVKPHLFYDITNDRIMGFHEINGNQKPDPATNFLVIMVRGIIHNWKQLIAHAFLSHRKNDPEVNEWIDIIITTLLDIGLDIRVFVSDLDSHYVSASKSISNDKTYFEINGHKIYYMFDAPQLIKSLRDELKTPNFIFYNEAAHCSQINDAYNQDVKQENRTLTISPIDPEDDHKRDVKISVPLIPTNSSNTFGTEVNTNVHLNSIDVAATSKPEFVKKINYLNDLLNSNTIQSRNQFKRASSDHKLQIDFLKEMLELFEHLKVIKTDKETDLTDANATCIKGFQVSIRSLLQLNEDFIAKGIKFIHTRRLNADVLEKFFCKVRQAGGAHRKPTCRRASSVFKKMFICDILKTPAGTNGNEDFNSLIMKQDDYRTLYSSSSQVMRPKRVPAILVGTYDYQFDLPEKNALIYVSCYLYRKCINQHKCVKIKAYIEEYQQNANLCNDPLLCRLKNDNEGSTQPDLLVIPPESFVSYIKSLEKTFRDKFDFAGNIMNVGNGVLRLIEHSSFDMQCECFPIEYLKKLYTRFRIYQTIKRNNALLKVNVE